MTVKKEYLTNNFDAIRLLGALQVIICNHYFFHFKLGHEASLWNAFSGVPIFFFLAGIFIPMSFERNSEILNYARNRILKIFPVMWCSIALSVFLMFVSGFKPEAPLYKFLEWLGVYMVYPLYTPEWLRGYGVGAINGSLWIIPIQLTFYALVPLAYLVMKAKKLPPSLCAIIFFLLMLVCKTAMLWLLQKLQIPETSAVSKAVLSSFLVHFPMFIIGMFFYANFDFFYKLARNRFPIFLIIHICAFYAVAHFGGTASVLATSGGFSKYLLMLTLALCVFSAGYSMQNLSDRILKRRDISYGLYVYHMPIANFIIYTAGTGMSNAMLAFALTVAVSILSYAFVESKFLGMKRRSIRNLS